MQIIRNTAISFGESGVCSCAFSLVCVCVTMRQNLPLDRRPRAMHFKTALRTSYTMTLLSFPMGWWYGDVLVELFAAFELRLVAFILLTVVDCM